MTCDRCTADAEWVAFAAYDTGDDIHPRLARYPVPQIRACSDHLAAALAADVDSPSSTLQWVVRRS